MRNLRCLLFSIAVLSSSGSSFADSEIDSNNDGEISQAEFIKSGSALFSEVDLNFDGKVTRQEQQAAVHKRISDFYKRQFNKMDKNLDGKVTSAEYDELNQETGAKRALKSETEWADWFEDVDVNRNGHISRLEFSNHREMRATELKKKRQEKSISKFKIMDKDGDGVILEEEFIPTVPGSPSYSRAKEAALPNRYSEKKIVKRDANGDGELTRSEEMHYKSDQFERMDHNSDGVITKNENAKLFISEQQINF